MKTNNIQNIVDYLSPNERLVIPHLKKNFETIIKETNLDETSLKRALEFLSKKNIIKLHTETKKIIEMDFNGVLYLKHGLPERRLINLISEKKSIPLDEALKQSKLSDNELKAAIGVLKRKALINLINSNLILTGKKEETVDKTIEELFLESLPKDLEKLRPEEKYAFENLNQTKKQVEDIWQRIMQRNRKN